MKASELRIGNWYENQDGTFKGVRNGMYSQVEKGSHLDLYAQWMLPIPLTEEWLLKFGFEKEEEYRFAIGHCDYSYVLEARSHNGFKDGGYFMGIRYDDWQKDPVTVNHFAYLINGVQYVHQLQNLYFALTGEELTIKQHEAARS